MLLTHPDYRAIAGLPAALREQRRSQAADAIERIVKGYEVGEHLAVVDRQTLLEHKKTSKPRNASSKKKRHGRKPR